MPDETEEWLGIRRASQEYNVAISYLYKIAYDPASRIETRVVQTGRVRHEIQFRRADLEKWQETRPERFKRKDTTTTKSEVAGRQELAVVPN